MDRPNFGGSPPAAAGHQATMREVLAVVFRRRWLVLGLFGVVTATTLIIAFTTPPSYMSSGRVLVVRGERPSLLYPNRQMTGDWEQDLASEMENVKSTPVLDRTREILAERARAGATAPLELQESGVDAEVMGKSNVLAVGYADRDPVVARKVCDALLTAYVEYRQNRQAAGHPEAFFQSQLDSISQAIEARSAEREDVARRSGVTDALVGSQQLAAQEDAYERARNETAADLAEAESYQKTMRTLVQNPDVDITTVGEPFYTADNALLAIKNKITDQQTRIASLREHYRDDSPEVGNALETLATLQALLHREMKARLESAQSKVDALRARLMVQDRDLAATRSRVGEMPANQRRLDDLDAEIKSLRSSYDEYVKARDQSRITENTSQDPGVLLLVPAGPAVVKNSRDVVRILLAPAFSIVVGLGLAFFIDGLDLTVRTSTQAEEYLSIPVLAALSERRNRRG